MSNAPSEKNPLLHVTSEDSGVLITILDRDFMPVTEGTGEVKVRVPPGLYEARFQAGTSVREQVVRVDATQRVHPVVQRRIAFATAAPLPHTRSEYPLHRRAAERLSRSKPVVRGKGGQLMLFVRDLDFRARSVPTEGLTLHRDLERPLEVAADGRHGGGGETRLPPWAGCHYELDEGAWILRHFSRAGAAVEQAVVVSRGWQTQVFLERGVSRSGRARRPKLADAAVLMASPSEGFRAGMQYLRTAELARQGLRDRRSAIDAAELKSMLAGKLKDPMLAVYGAHLLVNQPEPDVKLIKSVVGNLQRLIGPHPDVRALKVWLGEDGGSFSEPPMLKSSWSILVKASATAPELVPRGSLSAMIAESVIAGGPWLRWRAPRGAMVVDPPAAAGVPLGRAIAEVAAALPEDPREVYEHAAEVTPAQASVIALAQLAGPGAGKIKDVEILKSLRVPRTVAEDSVGAVLDQLTE